MRLLKPFQNLCLAIGIGSLVVALLLTETGGQNPQLARVAILAVKGFAAVWFLTKGGQKLRRESRSSTVAG